MTVRLENALQIGDRRVAALVRVKTMSRGGRRMLCGWIAKQPLAVLIAEGEETRAFDMSGNPISPDEVERLCAGAISAFERQAQ